MAKGHKKSASSQFSAAGPSTSTPKKPVAAAAAAAPVGPSTSKRRLPVANSLSPHDSADIPGMNLTFAPTRSRLDVTSKGGLIDHVGFEVGNLAAFCQKLEAKGVKFDQPYKKIPSLGIATAFLTDPKGVSIELTEGLGAY